jgi:hypothetical protein
MEQRNMKSVKILIALILIVAAGYWTVTSALPQSHSGSDLTFETGSGAVKVTNPSSDPIPAQLVAQSRSFSVASALDGLSGSSTRQGSGASATYELDFVLPPGVSEFTITRGQNVNFVASTDSRLEATVQPMSASSLRTTLIAAAVVTLVALFYISSTTNHRWIGFMRGQKTPVPA